MSVTAFNRRRRELAKQAAKRQEPAQAPEPVQSAPAIDTQGVEEDRPDDAQPGEQVDGQGLEPSADERQALVDAYAERFGKKPGNMKTETIRQKLEE